MLFPLLAIGEIRAQALTYSGPLGSASALIRSVGGSYESYQYTVASAGQQITVDPTALTLSFDGFQILTAPLTISKQIQITAGFGQVKTYNLSLNFYAKVFSFNDGGAAHSLSPTTGGNYEILNTGNLGYVTPVGGASLTGTYSVTGPTQSATGSFNVPINGYSYMMVPNTLNTSSYPDRLTLSHSNGYFYTSFNFPQGGSSGVDFIDATVDGATMDWR